MKFGDTFMQYLQGDQTGNLVKCAHVEYKILKKVLKNCRSQGSSSASCKNEQQKDEGNNELSSGLSQFCHCESCPLCDQIFFSELMREASHIAGCFSSRVRHLLHLHVARGIQRYKLRLRQCFKNDQQTMAEEGRMLIEYVIMNAIAIRKILKKYDKVHCSVNGNNFKSKMQAEHIELLQSPWLIELGAFYLNFDGIDGGEFSEFCSQFSCDLNGTEPVMTLTLPNSMKLEYSLTCAICLETVFNPYALSCGHLFCKLCACSAAFVLMFEGLKTASSNAKCPICREAGVYTNAVHMLELDLLQKRRCNEYWKERMAAEHAEDVKQTREYWDSRTKYAIGFLEPHGLFSPLDPGKFMEHVPGMPFFLAGPGATIGGMCATRCSGSIAVRYGTMRDNVISLKVVLPNGDVVKTASRARKSAAGEGILGVTMEVTLWPQKFPLHSVVTMYNFLTIKDAADVAIDTMLSGIQVSRVELLDEVQVRAVNIANENNLTELPTLIFEFICTGKYGRRLYGFA
ncbi:hypothetical protein NC653_018023 [Populus alba x Populus x berolinensis]|uniref:RING-type E3 ubiquitin transferase n=1 Tax=Populus alba x Populus x berolinensis TaxID=444605 RepID=A0AAD6QRX2_9ROSI|nr:hypothetical protein NC653_018023 [Populus alba x Populus x berolinensis]